MSEDGASTNKETMNNTLNINLKILPFCPKKWI